METSGRSAPNAATLGARSAKNASPSQSARKGCSGTAGTAAGTAESFTRQAISDAAEAWVQKRRISRATLERLGVASGTAYFPNLERKAEALFFPYDGGWKARALSEKAFVSNKGFKLSFWNIGRVIKASPASVYITEGELDALALVEAGISADAVLSVPNGAREKRTEEVAGYDYVLEALRDGLKHSKKFIWCGDNDAVGLALRSDMAQLFGAARFYFVNWPEGYKDANDLLVSGGPEALLSLVDDGALPWPVDGVYRLSELPEPAPLELWNPGFPEWEGKVMLAARMLSVVTGNPGHGKTALWGQIWFNIVRAYCVPMFVASFETRPKPHLRRQFRTLYCGALGKDLTTQEIAKADEWIEASYLFAVHPDGRPNLEWLLDKAEVAVIRHGARIVQIDPWNRLEGARGQGENETDYIGRCLRTLHTFANDFSCHVQILAHPAKVDFTQRRFAPSLEDISGSKHWDNMPDQGFVVHRPITFNNGVRETKADLYYRKARFDELGYPCKLGLDYEISTGCFVSTDYDDDTVKAAPKKRAKGNKTVAIVDDEPMED